VAAYGLAALADFKPRHPRLIGLDSDGTVFDTMPLKQLKCFWPVTTEIWGLQGISDEVRAAVEFAGLRSRWRGLNRYRVLLFEFELLAARAREKKENWPLPDVASLAAWVGSGSPLTLQGLHSQVCGRLDPVLKTTLAWSEEIDRRIAAMVARPEIFPGVPEILPHLAAEADIAVISTTPEETLRRDWEQGEWGGYPTVILGQEAGAKAGQLARLAEGRYAPGSILVIGDAAGDRAAAQETGAMFYPILAGREVESWKHFAGEAFGLVLSDRYHGSYEDARVAEFGRNFADQPAWPS
jgi:phosphoglycolate phosphatase-like HAD superfamily hydrolase